MRISISRTLVLIALRNRVVVITRHGWKLSLSIMRQDDWFPVEPFAFDLDFADDFEVTDEQIDAMLNAEWRKQVEREDAIDPFCPDCGAYCCNGVHLADLI